MLIVEHSEDRGALIPTGVTCHCSDIFGKLVDSAKSFGQECDGSSGLGVGSQ